MYLHKPAHIFPCPPIHLACLPPYPIHSHPPPNPNPIHGSPRPTPAYRPSSASLPPSPPVTRRTPLFFAYPTAYRPLFFAILHRPNHSNRLLTSLVLKHPSFTTLLHRVLFFILPPTPQSPIPPTTYLPPTPTDKDKSVPIEWDAPQGYRIVVPPNPLRVSDLLFPIDERWSTHPPSP
jgi:hypothetical protein